MYSSFQVFTNAFPMAFWAYFARTTTLDASRLATVFSRRRLGSTTSKPSIDQTGKAGALRARQNGYCRNCG